MNKNTKRNIKFILPAIIINNIGDVIFDLFLAWGLSASTGMVMNAVYVIGTSIAFRAILSFFMGAFVDRHSKKQLMIVSHISSIIVIALFGLLWEFAKQRIIIGILFVLLNDINNEMFLRSYISMTADMFDENTYIKFRSYSSIAVRIVVIGGTVFSGLLIEYLPSYMIFGINIITYFISLLLIAKITYEEVVKKKENNKILKQIVEDVKYTYESITKSSFLLAFIVLMFLLNLAYGYIPQVLPIFKANRIGSATFLGAMKSAITIGEIIGLFVVGKLSRYVSKTFQASMLLNIFIMIILCVIKSPYLIIALFGLYGLSDALTQPLFSYTVSKLDNNNRGKLLGGIDAIIMFSPSIGIYIISAIYNYNELLGGVTVALIFFIGFCVVSFHTSMKKIVLRGEEYEKK